MRFLLFLSVASLLASACKKDDAEVGPTPGGDPVAEPAAGGAKSPRPPGPTGTISGRVTLVGTPPEMPLLQRGSDSFCGKKEMRAETVLVGSDGGLANALVRIAPGAVPGWVPSDPVLVDQVDCMYRPRVQGAVQGQMLHVANSDQTMHNVNARRVKWGDRRDTDTLFNRGQPKGSPVLKGAIRDGDIMKLKCDSHGWMQGYVVVSDNPYHSTTADTGRFTIKDAPVGSYELQVWHEYYGIKPAKVTVTEGKTATVDVSYDADKDKPASAGGASPGGASAPAPSGAP